MNESTGLTLEQAAAKMKSMQIPDESAVEAKQSTETVEDTQISDETGDTPAQETGDTPAQRAGDAETTADEQTIDAEQFASLLGLDAEKLLINEKGEIKFKTKVDGEESDATLNDLIERYQRDAHLTNRSKEVAELKKKAEENANTLFEKVQQAAQQADTLYKSLEAEVLQPFQNIDWNELRVTDPAEYAARRAELSDVRARLDAKRNEVMQKLSDDWKAAQQAAAAQRQTYLAEQQSLLPKMVPNWNESTKTEISNYLASQGFTEEEVAMVGDARMVSLANKAMLYDRGKSRVATKLEKPIPKVLKPGGKPSAQALKGESIKQATTKLRESGSLADAVALLKLKAGKG